ncbi:peptidoglycan-binding domain-containing protein [Streptomyces sp. ALI-76-A]|uniref:peptidoglycan-binding domain-containing protein n=1 Tax=Streptomyces sp. ALI-76-A TaxID=3025736 RepID=UPI00256F008D|nr:peptidoglycan-binding domain-containing protein [Streptomyces sp. ALI-76-A]MDL5205587.1 peptidoglycan-binding domain-containing protein [Streptomyces sp. ALI-76-A]
MPTPPDREQPHEGPPLEPIRVLRPRRTDALAELIREYREQSGRYEAVEVPASPPPREEATEELPQVADDRRPAPGAAPRGRPRGLRRTAVAGAVAAAALVGFGSAFLLPGRGDATAAPAPSAPATTSAEPGPPASPAPSAPVGAADPDGPGTLREGAAGPGVTDLQQRLLRVPNVYDHGSTSGRYDATLTEAVARFQLWYGVRGDETGVYGDDTRRALESRTGGGR